jgi:hypothetical protein
MEEEQPKFLCKRVGDGYQNRGKQNLMSKMRKEEKKKKKYFLVKQSLRIVYTKNISTYVRKPTNIHV